MLFDPKENRHQENMALCKIRNLPPSQPLSPPLLLPLLPPLLLLPPFILLHSHVIDAAANAANVTAIYPPHPPPIEAYFLPLLLPLIQLLPHSGP